MLYSVFALLLVVVLVILLWPVRARIGVVITISLLFFIGAFGLYKFTGSPEIVPMLHERDQKLAVLKETIVRDSDIVKADPDNLKAWVELGQSFAETGQYNASANAFKHSVKLSGGNPTLILAYAKAMILEDDGKVSDQSKKSLEMVLLQDHQNPEARYWLIVRKLQDGHQEEAMKEMKALYRSLPAGSPLKETIDRQIGRTD